jgi:5-methylthioadenosine/S-adenosylhomocysteine deaminase
MAFDTLIYNGTLVTGNDAFEVIENGWVGITGTTIATIEPYVPGDSLPAANQVIDACGGLIMPGLVNTHTHLPMTIFRGLADDLALHVWLNEHMFPAEATHIMPETVRAGSLLACAEMLLSGTTTCCDGYFYEDVVAEAVSTIGMRGVLGQGVIECPAPGVPDPTKNVAHAIHFMDRWMEKNPLISPSIFCHSPYTCSEETLVHAKQEATKRGVLFQIHVAETKAEREEILSKHGVTPVGYLDRLGILDDKTLLVHTIWVDPADIDLISKRNAPVSVTTESEMKLASGIAPIPGFLEKNITVGLGTDGCASNNDLDMFQEMDMTAKLHKVNTLDPTVMDAKTVLSLATREGAKALGLFDSIGSLAPGKQADIIVLDTDAPHFIPMYSPVSHLVYTARGSDVRDVLVAGRLLVKDRQLLTIDLDEVMQQVRTIGKRIKP